MWSPSFSSTRRPGVGLHLTVKLEYAAAPLGGYILLKTQVHTLVNTFGGAPLSVLQAVPSGTGCWHYLTHGISWLVRRLRTSWHGTIALPEHKSQPFYWGHLSADSPTHGSLQILLSCFVCKHASWETSNQHLIGWCKVDLIFSTQYFVRLKALAMWGWNVLLSLDCWKPCSQLLIWWLVSPIDMHTCC